MWKMHNTPVLKDVHVVIESDFIGSGADSLKHAEFGSKAKHWFEKFVVL